MHNKLIIFEGIDRVGKSSLREALRKKMPGLITIDRLTPSNYVYSTFYKREEDKDYLAYLEAVLSTRGIVVYCYCNYQTYLKRCNDTKHEILSEKEFNTQRMIYDFYFKYITLYQHIIKFDTSDITVERILKILIPYINNLQILKEK
jgi:thymidylate kinase